MNKLKELREEKSLLQREVADMLGVSRPTYNHWENGKVEIDFENLKKLANFYNVTIDYLIGFEPTEEQRSVINEVYETAQELGLTPDTIKNMTSKQKEQLQQIIKVICNEPNDK